MFCFVLYLPDILNTACSFIYGNLSVKPSQKQITRPCGKRGRGDHIQTFFVNHSLWLIFDKIQSEADSGNAQCGVW